MYNFATSLPKPCEMTASNDKTVLLNRNNFSTVTVTTIDEKYFDKICQLYSNGFQAKLYIMNWKKERAGKGVKDERTFQF